MVSFKGYEDAAVYAFHVKTTMSRNGNSSRYYLLYVVCRNELNSLLPLVPVKYLGKLKEQHGYRINHVKIVNGLSLTDVINEVNELNSLNLQFKGVIN